MTRAEALKMRANVELAAKLQEDKDASDSAWMYPKMKYDGSLIAYKDRINWNGAVKQAAQDLWDREENNPDNAPNLWDDIEYYLGIRVIPEIITAGKTFKKGEQGWWHGVLYESKYDNNAYNPEQWPDGWIIVE